MALRTATGGFSRIDVQATALSNRCYVALVNNSEVETSTRFLEDGRSGGSLICGPDGACLAEAPVRGPCIVATGIEIARLRQNRRIPDVHRDLYRPLFDAYRPRYPTGLYSAYQPTDLQDAAHYLAERSRWD